MKLYCALYGDGYPFDALVDEVEAVSLPEELTDVNSILVVWGGSDINPELYGHPRSNTTYPGGKRDVLEWALMKRAVELNIPIIGVCRGAQMLCALAGGYLLQDVRNHGGRHLINTSDGQSIMVNSIHHQMMEPSMTDHELLAWVERNQSPTYIWKDDQQWIPPENWKEPEFVYYTKVRGFAIQWHPEMMAEKSPANQYVLGVIKEKLCLNTTPELESY